MKRNKGLLIFFSLLLFVTGCGGGNSSDFSSGDDTDQSLHRGQLLGSSLLSNDAQSITYKVKAYKIIYATTDVNHKIIKASGLLAIPQKATGEKSPLLSYQHGTIFLNKDAPSLSASTIAGIKTLASTGYIVSAPDFLGYGESASIIHPYIHANSLASASIDMLRASKAFLANNNITLNSQLFLTGYSEGGYATIAMQKTLLEKHAGEFKVTASSAGAGPYDLTESAKILSNKVINDKPSYMSFLLKAYDEIYQLNAISDMYQPPYVAIVNRSFDGKHSGGEIDRSLNHTTTKLFKAPFLNALQGNGNHVMLEKLAENNIYDWKPLAPTRLYHSPHDETVPYANSRKAFDTMRENGAEHISLQDCFLNTHVSCALPYVIDTLNYFSRYANDL
jgi:predicted peptidase